MAQRQFAEQADDQIQGNREDDINGNGDQHIGELTAGTSGIHKVRDNRIDHGNHENGQQILAELRLIIQPGAHCRSLAFFFFLSHRYTFSLICLPNRPVGFTTRTMTRTPNTMASDQRVET